MSVGGWGPEIIAMATHKNNPVRKGKERYVYSHIFRPASAITAGEAGRSWMVKIHN